MELILATRNEGKIREIREILSLEGLTLVTYRELPAYPEPEETGETLEENAVLKAKALRVRFGLPALGEDSGLMVDRLGGRPGVCSSRYAGPECDPERNIDLLLSELAGVDDHGRSARFMCVAALALPDGGLHITGGECTGRILTERRGTGGFGYDPVFMPDGYDRSMAELSIEEKNAISHRGKALRAMRGVISRTLGLQPDG